MSLDQFIAHWTGKSPLYAPSAAREYLRGQCVQLVAFYVTQALGKPTMWRDAAEWWYSGLFPEHYERIHNSRTAVPQRGDIIIWDRNLPNSGGAGHIAVCVTPRPGTGTFVSFDSNWGGKTAKLVTHNYNYVIGWLRPKGVQPPAPQPQPTPQGDKPMNPQEEQEAYDIVLERQWDGRPTGRTGIAFMRDARKELADKRQIQKQQLANMQEQINTQNVTITELSQKLTASDVSNADKQKALNDALAKLTHTNAELANAHDRIKELEVPKQPEPTILTKLLTWWVGRK